MPLFGPQASVAQTVHCPNTVNSQMMRLPGPSCVGVIIFLWRVPVGVTMEDCNPCKPDTHPKTTLPIYLDLGPAL